ncbi:MAG: radical SAM protein [Bacteroidales bacterium]|jgi:radical SAM superfamily enzyme YgiQ (UPF0313 family)|nr:B12-binding domain-containing radical SAM protein [Bacteroidales bacterium]MDD4214060.1 radical SAM protein [Bacteroidales bacterium]
MKKKLLLVSVVDKKYYPGEKCFNPNPAIKAWQPVQLGIIAALTPEDWDIEIIDENYEDFKYTEAGLVGISAYTTSVYRAYQIAQEYKGKNIPVVLGGYHATFFPEEASQYVDVVAVGRAEGVWPDILKDFESKSLQPLYTCDTKIPAFFKQRKDIFKKYDYPIGTVMASLGCPYNCDFCAGPVVQNHHYYLRDIDETVEEIKQLEQDYFIFSDDNFIGSSNAHKDRVVMLLQKMIEQKVNKKWQCAATINVSQYPDLLKLAHKAGCVLMYIGIESYDENELLMYNKSSNEKFFVNNYKKAFREIHKNKIAIFGGYLCGTENDNLEDYMRKAKAIIRSSVDSYTFTFVTPLPKTKLFTDYLLKGKLLYTSFPEDWIYYNCYCATVKLKNGNEVEHHSAYNEAMIKLYSMPVLINKFIRAFMHIRSVHTTIHVYTILKCVHNNDSASVFLKIMYRFFEIKKKKT